jgi:hypothetical protein
MLIGDVSTSCGLGTAFVEVGSLSRDKQASKQKQKQTLRDGRCHIIATQSSRLRLTSSHGMAWHDMARHKQEKGLGMSCHGMSCPLAFIYWVGWCRTIPSHVTWSFCLFSHEHA